MSNVTIAGWSVGSVDGVASVQEKWEAYLANKNANTLAAYKAAFYNALAAETALIPGAGAYFAALAVSADITDMKLNGKDPGKIITIYGGTGNSYYWLSNGNNWLDAGGGNDAIQAARAKRKRFPNGACLSLLQRRGPCYSSSSTGSSDKALASILCQSLLAGSEKYSTSFPFSRVRHIRFLCPSSVNR